MSPISLMEGRKMMQKALKSFIIPEIRKLGFSGSYPHFRRKNGIKLEFISFQFNRYGGSFIIESGKTTKENLPEFAQALPFEKLNVGFTAKRMRLGATEGVDPWYHYEGFKNESDFDDLAKTLQPKISQIEEFFNKESQ